MTWDLRPARGLASDALALAAGVVALGGCATGAEVTLYSENDLYAVGNHDRYYTNGARLSVMHRADSAPEFVRKVAEALPQVSPQETTQIGWVVGQDMYTPSDTKRDPPDPNDRPYGGWLYTGVIVSKAVRHGDVPAGDRVDVLEADLGVVGPPSLAEQTQISYHHLIGVARPQGWDAQIGFEPGVVATYEHRRRLLEGVDPLIGGECDALGVAGASLGNVFTHGTAGAMVRWGNDLRRDFGPSTIHSTAVNVPGGDDRHGFRTYLFGGVEGRAVARNIFLDGNTFRDSPSVDKRPLVGEVRVGFALEWGSFQLGYSHNLRTREFYGQKDPQAYGSITLSWSANF